ncbi:MAG: hypothetical protein CMD84_04620 [Gammaproteobacteria bacterium]|nr:hypothetical protein [Gammaproteobacteria bacterium]|tara:strand:- start:4486 stop:5268 length:783 start_codon:yes stop_codon:yes gene_type:complete
MKNLLTILIVLLGAVYVLETIGVVPKSDNSLTSLVNIEIIKASIRPILYSIDSFILLIIAGIKSLPFHLINPWYVLVFLFVAGLIYEKFRILGNEINSLKREIFLLAAQTDRNKSDNNQIENNDLSLKTDAIMNILIEIQKAADHFKSTQLRNKKVRRDQIVEDIGEPKLVKKKISKKKVLKKKVAKKTISKTKKEESQNEKEAMKELIEDEHISQNDLARTLMASGDNKKAIEVITNVINTGTEDEKHEARLLYMQIRK